MTALFAPPHSPVHAATAAAPLVLEPPRYLNSCPQLLTPGQFRIGSAADCQIRIDVDGIASEHATILAGTHRVVLRANDPRTWLNDGPVKETILRHGDRVSFGPASFRVRRASPDELLAGWPAPELPKKADAAARVPEPVTSPSTATSAPRDAIDEPSSWMAVAEAIGQTLTEFAHGPAPIEDVLAVCGELSAEITPFAIATTAVEPPAEAAPVSSRLEAAAAMIADLQDQQRELADVRKSLDAARSAFREETLHREEQFTTEAMRLARHAQELLASQSQLDIRERDLRGRVESLAAREEQLRHAELALAHREQLLVAERDRLAELTNETREQLQAEAARQATEWRTWETQQQNLLTQFAEQSTVLDQQRLAIGEQQRRLDETERELRQLRHDLEQQRSDLRAEREQLVADRLTFQTERDAWLAECRAQQSQNQVREQSLRTLEQDIQLRSEQIRRQQEQLTIDIRDRARSQADLQAVEQQLDEDRRLLSDRQSSWQHERDLAWQDITERRKRLDAEADLLQAARHEIERLEQALEAEVQAAHADRLRWQTEARLLSEQATDTTSLPIAAIPSDAVEQPFFQDVEALTAEHSEAESVADSIGESNELDEPGEDAFDESESVEPTSEMEDIQAALDALAERFEEFSVLEHRLTVRHDELLELQQDLAVREAALDAEREALGLERATWEADRAMWAEEQSAAESTLETRQTAWEIARQSQQADIAAERRRWAAHMAELSVVIPPPIPSMAETLDELSATPHTSSMTIHHDPVETTVESPLTEIEPVVAESHEPSDSEASDTGHSIAQEANEDLVSTTASIWERPLPDETAMENYDSASGVRSELARMFNLPENFAESHEPRPSETAEAEEPDWRQSLLESLAEPPQKAAEPATATADEITVETENLVEEDSVDAYMEQLLARTRQRTGMPDEPDSTPQSLMSPSSGFDDAASIPTETERPADPVPTREKIDREATRAEMQSFREVANLSARTALAAHSWKTTKTEFAIQNVLLLLSAAGVITFFTGPLRGARIQWIPGSICLMAAGWMAYRSAQTWQTLRRWRTDAAMVIDSHSEHGDAIEPTTAETIATIDEVADAVAPSADTTAVSDDLATANNPAHNSAGAALPTECDSAASVADPPAAMGSLWDDVWTEPAAPEQPESSLS